LIDRLKISEKYRRGMGTDAPNNVTDARKPAKVMVKKFLASLA
jgi:hypothetical protein